MSDSCVKNDLFQPVRDFEQRMAEFTGYRYGVSVESCTAALFLSLMWVDNIDDSVCIPRYTYPSVAAAIVHAGEKVSFITDNNWQNKGWYELGITDVIDSAKTIRRGFGKDFPNKYVCLSFHHKKCLPIGRGGMIMTNNYKADEWLRMARHDGRHDGVSLLEDNLTMVGWNMLMTPEQASRGIALMGNLESVNTLPYEEYPDLSKFDIWK